MVRTLATKHPIDDGPEVNSSVSPADQLRSSAVTKTTLKRAVFGTPNNRAAGPSGWTFELLKLVCSDKEGLLAFLELAQQLAAGNATPHISLLTCSLSVLTKPGGGIRPIAVSEPIASVVSKCLARSVKDKAATMFKGMQYAGGMRHGIDAAILKVKACLVERPNNVVMSVDIANAFNEGRRGPMMDRVRATLPEVLPWACTLYGTPTPLHLRGVRAMHSRSGQRQGDALSMLLFCATLQPAIEEADAHVRLAGHKLDVIAYADDVKVVASDAACRLFLAKFSSCVSDLGLRVNAAKTEWYQPQQDAGCILFGAPVGTCSYIRESSQHILDGCQDLANKCVILAREGFVAEADQLLRRSIRPKVAALLRVVELPSDMLDFVNAWMMESLRLILGNHSLGWVHTAPRPSEGGLAFPKLGNTARSAEAKAKKLLHSTGYFIPAESVHVAFMALPSDPEPWCLASSPPPVPPSPAYDGVQSEHEKRKAGEAFAALPQWIMSAAQNVPHRKYKAALLAHLGMQRLPKGLAAGHLRGYPNSSAIWRRLLQTECPPDLHCRAKVRAALQGCGSFTRTRLSFALMFDVAAQALGHELWQQRKRQAGWGR